MIYMTIKTIFAAAALFFSLGLSAQEDSITIKKISDEVMTNGGAYENLRFLCKKIGPRLSGSANAQKAVEATARSHKSTPTTAAKETPH